MRQQVPSEDNIRTAAAIRVTAGRRSGFTPRRAIDLVRRFGLEFTAESVQEVDEALAHLGLAAQPPLSAEEPKRRTRVVIVGAGAATAAARIEDIEIWAGEPAREYRVLAPLKARVTAATLLSKTPTVEDVNLKLREQASLLGANAVINVAYQRGVSATSWKALTAQGTGIVLMPSSSDVGDLAVSVADELKKLGELKATGVLTEEEFAQQKAKLLGS